jgi:hypothetical protein
LDRAVSYGLQDTVWRRNLLTALGGVNNPADTGIVNAGEISKTLESALSVEEINQRNA